MIVQGTGLDSTERHTIGVTVAPGDLWQVVIDDQRIGPLLLSQDEAELVARWLRKSTIDLGYTLVIDGLTES